MCQFSMPGSVRRSFGKYVSLRLYQKKRAPLSRVAPEYLKSDSYKNVMMMLKKVLLLVQRYAKLQN